jgi:hypothetical protein
MVVPDVAGFGESAPVRRLDADTFAGWIDGVARLPIGTPIHGGASVAAVEDAKHRRVFGNRELGGHLDRPSATGELPTTAIHRAKGNLDEHHQQVRLNDLEQASKPQRWPPREQ